MRSWYEAIESLTGNAAVWEWPLRDAMGRWWIDNDNRQRMFLAQCAHESAGFRRLVENLNYSAEALVRTWPNRFTPALAQAYAHDPQRIAERAYGGRMGNDAEGMGDGWKYRGRGLIQITGRANYLACAKAIGYPVDWHPDDLEQPAWAAMSAGWFWQTHGCNELADAQDFEGITRAINGGTNGQPDRLVWLDKTTETLA